MASAGERNPFRPGPGTWPPVLAGREAERAALRAIAEDLASRRAGPIHLMEAPRGMGKTVLLVDLERSAPSGVTIVRTSAADLPDLEALAHKLALPKEGLRRLVKQVVGVSIPGLTVEREAQAPRSGAAAVEEALRSRRDPLLLAVDEAHALAPEVAHVLLNAMQLASGAGGSRAAVMLAGTPQLRPHLLSERVNASFVERAPLVAPGLLPEQESREALDAPAWKGWAREPSVLEEAARDSMGYPYFLQLWGESLWDGGRARRRVDRETLSTARDRVNAIRADFYARRYDEFETAGVGHGLPRHAMLAAVRAVAPLVSATDASVDTARLNSAIIEAGLNPDDAPAARTVMVGCGFLARNGDSWRAAIPSLAAYVRAHPR